MVVNFLRTTRTLKEFFERCEGVVKIESDRFCVEGPISKEKTDYSLGLGRVVGDDICKKINSEIERCEYKINFKVKISLSFKVLFRVC